MNTKNPVCLTKNPLNKAYFSKHILSISKNIALVLALFTLFFGFGAGKAEAVAPSLSAYNTGSNLIQITVNGDPNASVSFNYYQYGTNLPVGPTYIGTTNSAGYFSTTVAQNAYGITGGASAFVTVNGQQSPTVVWPTTNTINGGTVYLSQTSTVVSTGQNTTVTVYGGTGSYFVSSNTNPNAASVSISGNTVYINGLNQGSTTLNICSQNSTSNCATLLITVSGSYYGSGSVTLSQSSIILNQGQSQTVTINGSGSYYIQNNPNSSVATATINGNILTIYGINPGSLSFSICSGTGAYSCAAVYVNVSASYYSGTTYPYNYYNYNNSNTYPYYGSGFNTYPYNYNSYSYPTTYTQPTTYVQPTTYTYPSTYTYSGTQTGTPVSGVFLNQVPNTGISFGLKVFLFVLGLIFWSAFGAFVVYRKYPTAFAGIMNNDSNIAVSHINKSEKNMTREDSFRLAQQKKKGILG